MIKPNSSWSRGREFEPRHRILDGCYVDCFTQHNPPATLKRLNHSRWVREVKKLAWNFFNIMKPLSWIFGPPPGFLTRVLLCMLRADVFVSTSRHHLRKFAHCFGTFFFVWNHFFPFFKLLELLESFWILTLFLRRPNYQNSSLKKKSNFYF